MGFLYNRLAKLHQPSHKHDRSLLCGDCLLNALFGNLSVVLKQISSQLTSCLFGLRILVNNTFSITLALFSLAVTLLAARPSIFPLVAVTVGMYRCVYSQVARQGLPLG